MKTDQTLQMEFKCTKCDRTVNLPIDDRLFKCEACGGEECEGNFTLEGRA
jgi:ribosomal protein L37AE/L43A